VVVTVIETANVFHGVLLVASLCALGAAGLRVASLAAERGLERAVSLTVIVAATAVTEALALGLVGLGGSAAALTIAAALTWLGSLHWLPAAQVRLGGELAAWWGGLGLRSRAALGALAGAIAAFGLTALHRPAPGYDGLTYHLPEVIGFVQGGHPGTVLSSYYGLPTGNYPLTNEVLLGWMTALSRGFAALTLWSPAAAVLAAAAGWLALREMRVRPAVRTLALAAFLLGPLVVVALPTPGTDVPATTWLICCVALCLAARARPRLLCPAVVAFGLTLGTKTTPVLYGLIVLGWALWMGRSQLRALRRPLLVSAAAAAVVGTPWYLRDLIDHGSPLWPFLSLPWGDPMPPLLQVLSKTMAQRLSYTLFDNFRGYMAATSGLVVLLAGGVLVGLTARRRRPLIAALIVALGAVVWANSPLTGLPDGDFLIGAVGSTVRYLLPVFAAGAGALALCVTDGPRPVRFVALATLTGALAWGVIHDAQHDFYLPFGGWLAPGIVLGAAAGGATALPARYLRRARFARSPGGRAVGAPLRTLLWIVAAASAAVLLARFSAGYVIRHSTVATEVDHPVAAYFASIPAFQHSRAPIATSPIALGLVAGDTLEHPIGLVGEHESCSRILARARRGWVVVRIVAPTPVPGHPGLLFGVPGAAQRCLGPRTPLVETGPFKIYGPSRFLAGGGSPQ
jgi:hypothetical protein